MLRLCSVKDVASVPSIIPGLDTWTPIDNLPR